MVDLNRVVNGEFLPEDFFNCRFTSNYDFLKYESMDIGAVAIIINKDSDKCVLATSRKGDKKDFGLPGGKSNDKENIIDTLKREVFEETNLVVKDYKLVYASKAIDKLCFTFLCSCENLDFVNKEEHLGVELNWIYIGELFVKDYKNFMEIIEGRTGYSQEIYWKLLNKFLTKSQKTTFANYNFRTLRKLLNFARIDIAKACQDEADRIYGNFFKDVLFLYERALKESKYMNMMDFEDF